MKLHHTKHHQTYVTALNAAEESYAKAATPKERISLQAALKFNGGGHINHSLFWKNLAPAPEKGGAGGKLDGSTAFAAAVKADFGSLDNLIQKFNTATLGIQGSGWGWLGVNPTTKKLEIATTSNQDPLLTLLPVIGIDIWEHAFYLQYLNVKPDYLKAIWNVVNFDEAAKRYDAAVNSGADAAKL
ncbi:manganese superoxide dismutase [Phellopilus nigrolimitatus]|nr:manganese superoxide dismutase [Phellopilus nigrolimitatus]